MIEIDKQKAVFTSIKELITYSKFINKKDIIEYYNELDYLLDMLLNDFENTSYYESYLESFCHKYKCFQIYNSYQNYNITFLYDVAEERYGLLKSIHYLFIRLGIFISDGQKKDNIISFIEDLGQLFNIIFIENIEYKNLFNKRYELFCKKYDCNDMWTFFLAKEGHSKK